MSPDEHADVVTRYVAAGNDRDYDVLDALRTSDFVAHVPRGAAISESEPIRAADLNSDLRMITAAFPDMRSTILDLVTTEERVVVRSQLSGTFSERLSGVDPTGERIAWDSVHLYRLEGGKIAEAWFVTDTLSLLRKAGAVKLRVEQ